MAHAVRSPIWIFAGLCCPPEIEPSFLIPLRTPDKKSSRSGEFSSEFSSSDDEMWNLDSSEPICRRVSLSDMITHAGEGLKRVYETLKDIDDSGALIYLWSSRRGRGRR